MENSNKRINYIDIARGIAIILMVCGHADHLGKIDGFIALFNMSLFIFISGVVFSEKSINSLGNLIKFCFKKCWKIYICYFLFELLYFSLRNIFFDIGFLNIEYVYGKKTILPINSILFYLKNIFLIAIGFGAEPFCGAFWFLISLMFVICIYSLICFISKKFNSKKLKLILVVFVFCCGILSRYTINIPRFSPALSLLIMFYLGQRYKENIKKIKFNLGNFLLSLGLLILLSKISHISMNSNSYNSVILFILCSLSGIYVVFYISKIIDDKFARLSKLLIYIGRRTLSIMAIHFIGFKILMLLLTLFGYMDFAYIANLKPYNNSDYYGLLFFAYSLFGILFPIIISNIFQFGKLKINKFFETLKEVQKYEKCNNCK